MSSSSVRLNCCSILDVLTYDPHNPPTTEATLKHQDEDLYKLGVLMLTLSSLSPNAAKNIAPSLENLARHYSKELNELVAWLLRDPQEIRDAGEEKDADTFLRKLGPALADELEASENYSDLLEESLSKELENARLVRLLCKMGFINERPEYDHDPNWSSTGERYLISLFRDYLFHSVEDSGKPVLDLSHILTNLNRLDAGSEDKLMLTSRDEQSCLVVSYKEVSTCVSAPRYLAGHTHSTHTLSSDPARRTDQVCHRLCFWRPVTASLIGKGLDGAKLAMAAGARVGHSPAHRISSTAAATAEAMLRPTYLTLVHCLPPCILHGHACSPPHCRSLGLVFLTCMYQSAIAFALALAPALASLVFCMPLFLPANGILNFRTKCAGLRYSASCRGFRLMVSRRPFESRVNSK